MAFGAARLYPVRRVSCVFPNMDCAERAIEVLEKLETMPSTYPLTMWRVDKNDRHFRRNLYFSMFAKILTGMVVGWIFALVLTVIELAAERIVSYSSLGALVAFPMVGGFIGTLMNGGVQKKMNPNDDHSPSGICISILPNSNFAGTQIAREWKLLGGYFLDQ